ncbi:MAG: hypothetical protein ACRDKL_01930 [Solirubrobacteraceae bacterium]
MSDNQIIYIVAAGSGVLALAAFVTLVVAPALSSFRRAWERVAVVALSAYVFAALAGAGIALGAWIVIQWPRWF